MPISSFFKGALLESRQYILLPNTFNAAQYVKALFLDKQMH